MTSGSLWNYYRDKTDEVDVKNNAPDGKSFEYKTKIVGETPERLPEPGYPGDADQSAQPPEPSFRVDMNTLVEYLSNFWKSLDLDNL